MSFILISVLVPLIFAGITYIASQNLFSTLFIFTISLAFFVLIARRLINKNHLKIHRYHQCFRFINTFLISLNVKGSLGPALTSAYEVADESTKELFDSIKELDDMEKIIYLNKHFKFDLYHLFVDIVALWNEEGGDILKMSNYLVEQARLKEEYLISCESINKSKTMEFTILWAICLMILAILRFALSQFFSHIAKTLIYQIAIIILFLFLLVSIYILLIRSTNLNLEGWRDDEK